MGLWVGDCPETSGKYAVTASQEAVPPPTLQTTLLKNLILAFRKPASRFSETVKPWLDCRGSVESLKVFTFFSPWRALIMTRFTASLFGREKSWSTISYITTSAKFLE